MFDIVFCGVTRVTGVTANDGEACSGNTAFFVGVTGVTFSRTITLECHGFGVFITY